MSDYGDRSKAASHFNRRQPSNPFLASPSQTPTPKSADEVRQDTRHDAQSVPAASTSASADFNSKAASERKTPPQSEFNLSRWLKNTYTPPSRQPSSGRQSRYSAKARVPDPRSAPEIRRQLQPPQFSANSSAKKTTSYTVSRSASSPQPASSASPVAHQSRQSPPAEQRASHPTPPPGSSKVTPLRPKQVWPPSETRRRSRDRRPSKHLRRPQKSAPRPLLYIIRILILGIGVAVIAGTLLSILSPTEADTQRPAASQPTSGWETSRSDRQPAVNFSLHLANELVYLKQDIEKLATLTPGLSQSVFVLDLDTGNYVDVAGSAEFPAASTIKTPILAAFLQDVDAGRIRLDQVMTLRADELAGGSGEMQTQPLGTQYTVWQVASQMIITSDNTATNMMINLLGGAEALNRRFRRWGLTATVIRSPLPDIEGTNTTSTRDLVSLMALINRGELLSLRSRDRLLTLMQRTQTRSLLPSGVGKGAVVANKTGTIGPVLGDMALIDAPNGKRYALAALIRRPHNDGRARELIHRISRVTFKELNRAAVPVGETEPVPVEMLETQGSVSPQG